MIRIHKYWSEFNYRKKVVFFSLTGLGITIVGAVINYHHDKILAQLRNEEYKIPVGSLFKFVSCPNFFGEILEWWGFTVMTSFGTPEVCVILLLL